MSIVPVDTTSRRALTPYRAPLEPAWDDPRRLHRSVRTPFWMGMFILMFFLGAGGYWAATAPLSGGALAPGVIAPEGSRRKVQHYEGGIVHKVWAVEGEQVKKGDPLLLLKDAVQEAKHQSLVAKSQTLLAKRARLTAERSDSATIAFPADMKGTEKALSQQLIFAAQKSEYEAKRRVLAQRIEQLASQTKGYKALADSQASQLNFLRQELKAKDQLLRKGYARLPEALRLRRMEAELLGKLGELQSSIQCAKEKQIETELELKALETKRAARISVELEEVSNELLEVTEQLRATSDIAKRNVVRAPVTGRVANLQVKTIGGVVRRGDHLLDIVPSQERLLVEARLSPLDIDIVHKGLEAQVNLTAYAGGAIPRITGKVLMVAADSSEGRRAGDKPYYLAKVAVERSELAKIGDVRLTPGMPADVMIVTKKRTMLNYLLQPFRDAIDRSFREAT